MSSIFSRIINNEIPSYKIYEDNDYLALLDAFPLELGHVLVIPKKEVDYLFDLELDEYLGLWKFSRKIAKAMDTVLTCRRIGVAVIGFEVPHTHIHLIPINEMDDIDFKKTKKQFSKEEMRDVAYKIRTSL